MALLIQSAQRCATGKKPCWFSRTCERWLAGLCMVGLAWLFMLTAAGVGWGQAVSHEYPLKAVFLINFAQLTDWPTNAFDQADSAFVIGILGNDPFGTALEEAVKNERVHGRKLAVARFVRVEDVPAKACHILFICQSETRRLDKIVMPLRNRPVLTVSEIENAAYHGVCIRFLTENNKLKLRINLDSLKAAGLAMSSKLLRVAELIPATKP